MTISWRDNLPETQCDALAKLVAGWGCLLSSIGLPAEGCYDDAPVYRSFEAVEGGAVRTRGY